MKINLYFHHFVPQHLRKNIFHPRHNRLLPNQRRFPGHQTHAIFRPRPQYPRRVHIQMQFHVSLKASTSSLALTAPPPNATAATQLATIAKATPRIHLIRHPPRHAILDRKHSLSPIQMPRELMVLCFDIPARIFTELGNIIILPV
jgi:hypothetical protein